MIIMTIDEAWDRWLNAQPVMSHGELEAAKRAFFAAFAAGAGEGAAIDGVSKLPGIPSRTMIITKMLRLYQALTKEEPDTAVLLYGPSMAAVLDINSPGVERLTAAIELEKDIAETEAEPDDADV